MQINQYPNESFTFADNDYYDIDFWTGSGYETRKILGSVIKAGIAAAVATLYNADGTLSANRIVDFDGNNLNFVDASGTSTFDVEINDGSDYTKLTQDVAEYFIKALSGGLNSFLNVQGNQMNTESNDGGSNISSLVQTAFYCEWLKQNGIQYTRIRQESGQIFIEYNNGAGVTNTLAVDVDGTKINNLYSLPKVDGVSGQVLTTDGSGLTAWQDIPATSVEWGDITGTLSAQTDLQTELDSKLDDPNGTASQYIRGDGTVADFPSPVGAGSSVSFYLNGGTSQGTILGGQYYQLSQNADLGANADFSLTADGLIAQFITDVAEPKRTLIPGGNWNMQFYFSASSGGGSPTFYVELHKYDGTAFTLLGSSSVSPEGITGGTSIDLYYTAVAIPETVLDVDDRLAVRVYIVHDGRTITLHTQANHLSEVITTFSTGIATLNGLTDQVQFFATGTSGTNFNITSSGDTHTFNIPTASGSNTGLLSSADWTTFNDKADDNIYTADGTLLGNRNVIFSGNQLLFSGVNGITTISFDLKAASGSGNRYAKLLAVAGSNSTNFTISSGGAGISSSDSVSGESTSIQANASSANVTYFDGVHTYGIVADSSGTRVNNVYQLPIIAGSANQFLMTNGAGNTSWMGLPSEIQLAASDEISAITAGTGKLTFRMPHGMTLTGVRASLTTAQTSGLIFTVDILQSGVSILSTKLTIDNTERTSTTAATPAVISTSALTDDAEIRIDVTQIGDGTAKGLKVTLLGRRS